MPTVSLTVREYNDALVAAALAAHRATVARHPNPQNGGGDEGACRGIAGRQGPPFANPPPERKNETAKCGAPTQRKGGRRPLSPAERLARRRATWRASWARRKAAREAARRT
jgi:hypothetical protein